MADDGSIIIRKARVNNLKDVTVEIPRGKFVVITGISGSGKSSLAFDTLFAEGQRRFAESLSSYARQFLGRMNKPDVESIDGVPPAIAIEQKVNTRNPRSTVATTTEIYDYLRLLFARVGRTFSPVSGQEVKCNSSADVMSYIFDGVPHVVYMLADLGWNSREDKVELMLRLKEEGYSRFFSGGSVLRIEDVMQRSESGDFPEDLYLLVDRLKLDGSEPDADLRTRALASADTAFTRGAGTMLVSRDGELRSFVNRFELDGITFRRPDEYMFSFNSPLGACPTCGGLGKIIGVSEDLVIPDKTKSIYDGAIACWRGEKMGWFKDHLVAVSQRYGIPVFEPYCQLSEEVKRKIWDGVPADREEDSLIGIGEFFRWIETQRYKIQYKYMLSRFSGRTTCPECHGSRLRKDALYVKVGGKNIHEVLSLNVEQALEYFSGLELNSYERAVVKGPLDEIVSRLKCICDVGLGYLTLNRACNTLSGGESQRINLVTALGSSLVGSMYILDEPSIGLHQRDNRKLIHSLQELRDEGNSVMVVEHDAETMYAADWIVDVGPGAGAEGGKICLSAPTDVLLRGVQPDADTLKHSIIGPSLTLEYLRGAKEIPVPKHRRVGNGLSIDIRGARGNNLKNVDVDIPLGCLIGVAGVSGSGKSSLIAETLMPVLKNKFYHAKLRPLPHDGIHGIGNIDKLIEIDQAPIGRTPRSNPATFTGVFGDIRNLFAETVDAKVRGFDAGHFSFNVPGGRCEACKGAGIKVIEMNFLPSVHVPCDECRGRRYKDDTLAVRYKGKNINDILEMPISEAYEFFKPVPKIAAKLGALVDVGLGYVHLGQSAVTLSGGESQRMKLAAELFRKATGNTLYILDEPTTGLHFEDIKVLLGVLQQLVDQGNTVLIIEHNLDVLKSVDYLFDLGPEGGSKGGYIVAQGTPEQLARNPRSVTGPYLKEVLK